MIYRRQRTQYIFAVFVAVVAVVNVLFYFILTRPSQKEYSELQQSIAQLQQQVSKSRKFLMALETSSAALNEFDADKNGLYMMHLVKRSTGYSELLLKLDSLVKEAGVKKTIGSWTRFTTPMPGLESVQIVLPIEGNYTNVVKFIRELEKSETFFLIAGISVERSTQSASQPGGSTFSQPAPAAAPGSGTGAVALALTLETYFYQ